MYSEITIHNGESLNIDDVFGTEHIVRPGETIPSRSLERYTGGKGLNQSTSLTRAGARVSHISCIGEDGIFLKDGLEAEGTAGALAVTRKGATTGIPSLAEVDSLLVKYSESFDPVDET